MMNFRKYLFLLIYFFVFASIPVALCAAQSVIYVAGDGTGDYNCDGANDQVQINQALKYAADHPDTKVYLKGPFVYDIRSSCLIGSNTELAGDYNAKLRLANLVGWTTYWAGTPVIGQIGGKGSLVHDIKIHGFEIDGNERAQSGPGGKDLYRLISFQGSSIAPVYNIRVYNMNLHDSKGEGFRCTFGKYIYYYNNVGNNLQHTCVMYSSVNTGEIHDNVAHQCSCSGDRLDNCQNIKIYNENISPYSGETTYSKDSRGYAYSDIGIYVLDPNSSPITSNIVIYNCNVMSGVNGVLFDCLKDGSNVILCNNVITNSGYENEGVSRNGGIGIANCGNGVIIENNDIKGSDKAGINVNSGLSGTHSLTVKNNNIMNGKTGYAVINFVPSLVRLVLTHNYLYNNPDDFYPDSLADTNLATSINSKLPTIPSAGFNNLTNGNLIQIIYDYLDSFEWIWNFGAGDNANENPKTIYSADE